jgi:hypothetical protein
MANAALTRGTPLAGPKAMQASDIGSNGPVGAACGGANNILNSFFSISGKFRDCQYQLKIILVNLLDIIVLIKLFNIHF